MSVKETFFGTRRATESRGGGGTQMTRGDYENRPQKRINYPLPEDEPPRRSEPDKGTTAEIPSVEPELIEKIEKALAHQTELLEKAAAAEIDTEKLADDIVKNVVSELKFQTAQSQPKTGNIMGLLRELHELQNKTSHAKRVEEVWLIGKKAYSADNYFSITGEEPNEFDKKYIFINEKGDITGAATEEDFLIYEMRNLPIFQPAGKPAPGGKKATDNKSDKPA